jgi:hypothetical protein
MPKIKPELLKIYKIALFMPKNITKLSTADMYKQIRAFKNLNHADDDTFADLKFIEYTNLVNNLITQKPPRVFQNLILRFFRSLLINFNILNDEVLAKNTQTRSKQTKLNTKLPNLKRGCNIFNLFNLNKIAKSKSNLCLKNDFLEVVKSSTFDKSGHQTNCFDELNDFCTKNNFVYGLTGSGYCLFVLMPKFTKPNKSDLESLKNFFNVIIL